jgi:hypothetical protein
MSRIIAGEEWKRKKGGEGGKEEGEGEREGQRQ